MKLLAKKKKKKNLNKQYKYKTSRNQFNIYTKYNVKNAFVAQNGSMCFSSLFNAPGLGVQNSSTNLLVFLLFAQVIL